MDVQHNLAPGRKEEESAQFEVSKNHQIIITAPVVTFLWISIEILSIVSSTCEITLYFHRSDMELKMLENTQNLQDRPLLFFSF